MDGQLALPDIDLRRDEAPAAPPAPPASVIRFSPRATSARRADRNRLDGNGLAVRLRNDVERMVAHRRRMLQHLKTQSG